MAFDLWQPLAGLGLFLFAMGVIEQSLETVSGQAFRNFIRRNTDEPLKGVAAGTVATGVLQSSSLVGLMTLALVGAGVMRLRNALGIIFGANLGTTATGWMVATVAFTLDLDAAALPLIGLAGTLAIAISSARLKAYARIVFGIGLLLLGLSFMKSSADAIADLIEPETLAGFGPFQFLLFGVVFSALVQSSSATMMVTLSALHGGIIDLPSAAAAAIGADLGTTVTLLIGAFKGNAAKKRVAAGHFLFNLVTDLSAFALRIPLLAIVSWFALSDLLSLVAFHSLFNFLGILLFLPFTGRFANALERLFAEDAERISAHLAPDALSVAEAGVEAVELETGRLLKRVLYQNLRAVHPRLKVPADALPIAQLPRTDVLTGADEDFLDAYERSKRLEGEILAFTTDLRAMTLSSEQSATIGRCQSSARDAIHSSKSLKDVQWDLDTISADSAEAVRGYAARFRDAQLKFYQTLLRIQRSAEHRIGAEDFAQLETLNGALHTELHHTIYTDVRADLIGEHQISALLNVNRELFNSNQAILLALSEFLLEPAAIESLELVDHAT
jgi:phosphate:Na+ symporter